MYSPAAFVAELRHILSGGPSGPRVHVPSIDTRAWRELVEFRRRMIDKRTRCKNGIKAILRKLSIAAPFRSLWTKKALAWLKDLPLPTSQATLKRDVLLDELGHLEKQVGRVTKELDRLALLHPAVALLMTIPGIGPRTAEAFVAYVDDAGRFGKTRRIGAYLGLVPSQDASAAVNRLGHITREGPATLRKLLVEASPGGGGRWTKTLRCVNSSNAWRRAIRTGGRWRWSRWRTSSRG